MDNLMSDIRYAFRHAARKPGFAFAAVMTLAAGIGVSTTMFSIIHGILLRPLPYAEPDQLVRVYLASPERDVEQGALSLPDLQDWREQNSVFASLAGYFSFTRNLTGSGDPVSLRTSYVSEDFFATMGTRASLGRVLSQEELAAGAAAVVLSHGAWTHHFGGDLSVIGSSLHLDEIPYTVVGVMPPGFQFPDAETGAWVPLPLLVSANLVPVNRSARWLSLIGRLAPGRTVDQAGSEMTQIASRLAEEYSASNEGWNRATVRELRHTIVGDVGLPLMVALAAVLFVLLMVCSNLAGLLLARASARAREMAIRAALGAGRARLTRQLFAESLLLALLGGVVGVLVAAAGMDAIRKLILPILPRVGDVGIDAAVLAFAFVTTIVTSVLVGIVPALRVTGADLQKALKDGGRSGPGTRSGRLHSGLVVGQVAVAMILTISAGLMLRSFQQLRAIDPGFNPDGVLAANIQIPIPPDRSELPARIIERTDRIVERLRALSGVAAAGSVNVLPLRDDGGLLPLSSGAEHASGAAQLMAQPRTISGDYFRVMQIPLLAGALFPQSIAADAPMSAVVSYTTARRLWPDQDPIGRELWMGIPYRVIGVVGDVSGAGLTEEPPLTVYRHHSQQPLADVTLVIRAHGDPLALAGATRDAIRSADGNQSVRRLGTLTGVVSESVAQERFFTILFGGFSVAALLIATLGLYATLAYVVGQRTREMGVRMALGARSNDVFVMVLRRGLFLAGLGIVIGTIAALGMTRLLERMLHQVATIDAPTYVAVAGLLLMTAVVAGCVPAYRATRTDPMVALRAE